MAKEHTAELFYENLPHNKNLIFAVIEFYQRLDKFFYTSF